MDKRTRPCCTVSESLAFGFQGRRRRRRRLLVSFFDDKLPRADLRLYHSRCKPSEKTTDAPAGGTELRLEIPTAEDMEDIGALVASMSLLLSEQMDETTAIASGAGNVIFLDGDLGAGKTVFARGFLREATGDWDLRVTSPTYLLANTYVANAVTEGPDRNLEIHHIDLYRLLGKSPQEFAPLNLEHVFRHCFSIIEWPVRLTESLVPTDRLDITITIQEEDCTRDDYSDIGDTDDNKARVMRLTPQSALWVSRIQKMRDEGYIDDLIIARPT